jgi:hydroxyethylthiazole kinase
VYGEWLARVRQHTPLVHNITNLVVMQISANTLLAAGASPVMAHAAEEVEDMAAIAGALVLNIGTLDPTWVRSMELAAASAARHGVPVVLDPVGAGATRYRTEVAASLIRRHPPAVLRGNAGEISVLAGGEGTVRGVDAAAGSLPDDEVAGLARTLGGVVAATGPVDVVSDGSRVAHIANGDPWLARVTGTGCSLSALVGAFVAVTDKQQRREQALDAVVAALVTFEVAAEQARAAAQGPGTFHASLMDALFTMTPDEVDARAQVTWR